MSEVASSIITAETKGTSSAKTATNWPQCGTNGLLSPENGDHETAGDRQTSNSTFDSTSTAPPLPRGSLVASKLPTRRAVLMRNHSSTFTVADIAKKFDEIVAPCFWESHDYPDPDRFRPERFLERRFSPYEYLPFGGGARRCIGMAFAQFEMKLVISRILLSFEIAMADKRSVRPMRRGLTAVPSPIRLLVKDSLPAARLHRKSLGTWSELWRWCHRNESIHDLDSYDRTTHFNGA